MGAAQHLDTLNIKQCNVVHVLPGDVDVVDVGADWWVKSRNGFIVTLSAQVIHIGGAETCVVAAEQVRDDIDEVEGVIDLQTLDHLLAVSAHRDGNVLHRRLASFSSHQDFFELRSGDARYGAGHSGSQHYRHTHVITMFLHYRTPLSAYFGRALTDHARIVISVYH